MKVLFVFIPFCSFATQFTQFTVVVMVCKDENFLGRPCLWHKRKSLLNIILFDRMKLPAPFLWTGLHVLNAQY